MRGNSEATHIRSDAGGALSRFGETGPQLTPRISVFWSLVGVWRRHFEVYIRSLLANATPPVLEPLFFFSAVTLGLMPHMREAAFGGLAYPMFVATGVIATTAMWSAVFETTFSTYVRLSWQRTYDAMLSTHLKVWEVFTGEMLFCATKGAFFASVVMLVTALFGAIPHPAGLLAPLVGAVTAYTFAAAGLIVTSYVKMIQNFNFFLTGVITPLFFVSGTFFPVQGYHPLLDAAWFLSPLTHGVELVRDLYGGGLDSMTAPHLGMLLLYAALAHWLAIRRMTRRVLG